MACLNPHSYAVSLQDEAFRNSLGSATVLLPDGAGVLLASRLLKGCIRRRITGYDLFETLSRQLNNSGGYRVFFLGASDAVLNLIVDRFAAEYPAIEIVGVYSPPYKDEFSTGEISEMLRVIRDSKPDVLWVAMTAPKQEKWIANCINYLGVPFVGAIGAVFDFHAGTVRRPPSVVQSLHLEWLARLVQEPRRLWRRTFVSGPIFLFNVLKAVIREK
jgi:N-acetylglucosaminyldiphosphoundecaprenol N-acetyl-beta-D-mannosaminyltransferase